MINVLVVEDSPVVREFLVFIFSADPDITVVGTAGNGLEAIEAVKRLRPDVVTMDINMPMLNGFEATHRIMESDPLPIVIVSGHWDPKEVATSFRALEAGALAVLSRPTGIGHPDHDSTSRHLLMTLKAMSQVRVVRRIRRPGRKADAPAAAPATSPLKPDVALVAIGASTGGPIALRTILSGLPRNLSVPLLIVQHMTPGFGQGFVQWLGEASGFPVQIPAHGEHPLPGNAYVAPDRLHMGVDRLNRIVLSTDEPENGLRPSVSYLFRSVADVYGKSAIGVLLTGMGKDGARELKVMKDRGALTIAQDKESSVVHGMPGEAIGLDAATCVCSPEGVVDLLRGLSARMAEAPVASVASAQGRR